MRDNDNIQLSTYLKLTYEEFINQSKFLLISFETENLKNKSYLQKVQKNQMQNIVTSKIFQFQRFLFRLKGHTNLKPD